MDSMIFQMMCQITFAKKKKKIPYFLLVIKVRKIASYKFQKKKIPIFFCSKTS